MEKYEITKEEYLKIKKELKQKNAGLVSGVGCHNCTNTSYIPVQRNGKYYYECYYCGVLDNEN